MPQDWKALARAVRDRRTELGLTQQDLSQQGGPSRESVRQIEVGDRQKYRGATLSQLDRALKWRPGTAEAIVRGEAGEDPEAWKITVHQASARAGSVAQAGAGNATTADVSVGDTVSLQDRVQVTRQPDRRRQVDPDGSVWQTRGLLSREWEPVGRLEDRYLPLVAALDSLGGLDVDPKDHALWTRLEELREVLTETVADLAERVEPEDSAIPGNHDGDPIWPSPRTSSSM